MLPYHINQAPYKFGDNIWFEGLEMNETRKNKVLYILEGHGGGGGEGGRGGEHKDIQMLDNKSMGTKYHRNVQQ